MLLPLCNTQHTHLSLFWQKFLNSPRDHFFPQWEQTHLFQKLVEFASWKFVLYICPCIPFRKDLLDWLVYWFDRWWIVISFIFAPSSRTWEFIYNYSFGHIKLVWVCLIFKYCLMNPFVIFSYVLFSLLLDFIQDFYI